MAAIVTSLLLGCDRPAQQQPVSQSAARPDYFERKRLCMELADRVYDRESRGGTDTTVLNPEYCYSESLNTCLYAGGLVSKGSVQKWVRDCLTNREIAFYMSLDGKHVAGLSLTAFDDAQSKLMAGCVK